MKAKHFYVIGDPIAHSLSPVIHGAAFRVLGLPHTYETMRVPREKLPSVLDRVRRGEIAGVNVTVPHKVEALRLCDLFTDEVARVGAVNTVFVDATGRLVGSSTDVDGLRADLLAEGVVPKNALVLGTGGAARAAMVALDTLDAKITLAGRDPAAARAVIQVTQCGAPTTWDQLGGGPFDLIVNATSAGMHGGDDGGPIADAWSRASKTRDCVAYDLIYRPSVTPFLARAAAEGHRAICGIGMLVEQGARALSIFLGMPVDANVKRAMREAALSALPS